VEFVGRVGQVGQVGQQGKSRQFEKFKNPLDFSFCHSKLTLKHPGGIAVGAVMRDYGWFNSNTGCFLFYSGVHSSLP